MVLEKVKGIRYLAHKLNLSDKLLDFLKDTNNHIQSLLDPYITDQGYWVVTKDGSSTLIYLSPEDKVEDMKLEHLKIDIPDFYLPKVGLHDAFSRNKYSDFRFHSHAITHDGIIYPYLLGIFHKDVTLEFAIIEDLDEWPFPFDMPDVPHEIDTIEIKAGEAWLLNTSDYHRVTSQHGSFIDVFTPICEDDPYEWIKLIEAV